MFLASVFWISVALVVDELPLVCVSLQIYGKGKPGSLKRRKRGA